MRYCLAIFIIILSSLCFSQNRYLVSSSGNYIRVPENQSVVEIIENLKNNPNYINSIPITIGFPVWNYPPDTSILLHGKDGIGSWFEIPVNGTIDSVYFFVGESVGAKDSTVYLRIHQSIVGSNWGPGISPYPSPPVSWGYWLNSNDVDAGLAAFPDDATDTTWYSTIDEMGGSVPKSRPPFAGPLWGGSGYPIALTPNSTIRVAMIASGQELHVDVGEKIFISLRIKSDPITPKPPGEPTAIKAPSV